MNLIKIIFLFLFFSTQAHAQSINAQTSANASPRVLQLFDNDWLFYRGGAQGAENINFNDSEWRKINLPHDWSIEDIPGTQSPFHPDAISQVNGGFTTGGTGWYRKTFNTQALTANKRVTIIFDGIYMNAEVYLNGELLGSHPYGYTSFYYDITGKLNAASKNVVAVKVKNEGENSRWYAGSGIYRHVWLSITEPVRIAQWGTFITTPEVNKTFARISIKHRIITKTGRNNQTKVITSILDPNGTESVRVESDKLVKSDSTSDISLEARIPSPALWSTETPNLYKAVTSVYSGDVLSDREETSFGIRSIRFGTDGFFLNGESVKLKGGCVHHDNGPLGSKAFDRAEERRVELLKASGFNAIRSSHNPPSPAFLEACDRLGMLVIDEAFDMWRKPNNPHDYHLFFDEWWKADIESMIHRDRNHPSVILWSIGNEIKGMNTPEVVEVAKTLSHYVHSLDSTRPVTAAVNALGPDKDPFISALDIAGYNYASGGDHLKKDIYAEDHERLPGRIIFGSESYPLVAFQSWTQVADKPWVLGDFVWTAFDYIGEASIGWRGYYQKHNFYPWNLAYCGDIDICGWKRPQSFYRDALWKKNQVSVFVKPPQPSFQLNPEKEFWSKWEWHDVVDDWNWEGHENKPIEVQVYSSCERVELLLNGKSLGVKKTGRPEEYMAIWQVPYQKGRLTAVGYNGKKKISTAELRSAESSVRLALSADRTKIKADGQDLSYITVELVDKNGVLNRKAENEITFTISGPGEIVGVGNANPVSLESYQLPQRKLWRGKCLVIIRSNDKSGNINVTATAEGFAPATTVVTSEGDVQ